MVKKNYRMLLIVPTIVLLMAIGVLAVAYTQSGELFQRSIELRGGTLVTVNSNSGMTSEAVKAELENTFGQVSVKKTSGLSGSGFIIQADAEVDAKDILDALSGMGIEVADYSTQTIGPALGESFWSQAQLAIILAFIMLGIIIYAIFRTPVPSGAMMLCAVSDVVVTIAAMWVFGIELSLAGLAALLMLIGYSVDSDIVLATRLLKETNGSVKDRLKSGLKTGITMNMTTIGALSVLLVAGISPVLSQIAVVLLIGLITDDIFTWMQNSVILRWYVESKGL